MFRLRTSGHAEGLLQVNKLSEIGEHTTAYLLTFNEHDNLPYSPSYRFQPLSFSKPLMTACLPPSASSALSLTPNLSCISTTRFSLLYPNCQHGSGLSHYVDHLRLYLAWERQARGFHSRQQSAAKAWQHASGISEGGGGLI